MIIKRYLFLVTASALGLCPLQAAWLKMTDTVFVNPEHVHSIEIAGTGSDRIAYLGVAGGVVYTTNQTTINQVAVLTNNNNAWLPALEATSQKRYVRRAQIVFVRFSNCATQNVNCRATVDGADDSFSGVQIENASEILALRNTMLSQTQHVIVDGSVNGYEQSVMKTAVRTVSFTVQGASYTQAVITLSNGNTKTVSYTQGITQLLALATAN